MDAAAVACFPTADLHRAVSAPASDGARPGRPAAAAVTWQWQSLALDRSGAAAARVRARRSGTLRAVVGLAAAGAAALLGHPVLAVGIAAVTLGGLTIAWLWPVTVHAVVERWLGALGRGLGRALAWLLLTPLFVVFFWGFGRWMRRGRRDALQRWLDPNAPSYYRPRAPRPPGLDSYRRQF
jgi:hypothetical protein